MKEKILTKFKCCNCGEILDMDKLEYGISFLQFEETKEYFCHNCDETLFIIKERKHMLSEDLDITYKEKRIYKNRKEVKNITVGYNQELLFGYTETPIIPTLDENNKVVYTADIPRIDLVSSTNITHIPHAEHKMSMSSKDIISSDNKVYNKQFEYVVELMNNNIVTLQTWGATTRREAFDLQTLIEEKLAEKNMKDYICTVTQLSDNSESSIDKILDKRKYEDK